MQRIHRTSLIVVALGLLDVASVRAQSSNSRFEGMDRNRDGVISRSEWRGSDESFRRHDWNGDGQLSGEEVWANGRRGWRQGGDDDFGNGRDPELTDWTPATFARLDRDHDDRISSTEWIYDWETFRRIDRNRDGNVSRREFLGEDAAQDDDREDRFDALDVNRDGRVARNEWHGSRDAFEWLDRNGDGVLSRTEVVGETETGRTLFDRLDIDRNSRITLNEWRWSRASFDSRDRDRNGSLERDELNDVTAPRGDAYQKGHERGLIDGREAGRQDKTRRNRWDLDGQRELEQADAGYQASMGSRADYQAGYREAFREAYAQGFGPR